MNIEQRISNLSDDDIQRLLVTLNFALSGDSIGEGAAFDLIAEIEALAIKASEARNGNNPLGGLPDEQQAGYIA